MRLDIDIVTLSIILNSKTLSKILYKILNAYVAYKIVGKDVNRIKFSMEDLRKSLRYKNKSTVSRGLKILAELKVFTISTNNQGTVIDFNPDKVRRV